MGFQFPKTSNLFAATFTFSESEPAQRPAGKIPDPTSNPSPLLT